MENNSERRGFSRYPCTGAAEILQSGQNWRWGQGRKISYSGCYIETMYPLPTGTEVQLGLTIDGVFVDICANVVFSDPMFGMGMKFVRTGQWNKLKQAAASRSRVGVAIAFKQVNKVAEVDPSPALLQDGASPEEAQFQMQAVLLYLQQAQKEVQEATRTWQLIENAIHEVKSVCKRGSTIETTDPALMGSSVAWSCEAL